MSDSEGYNLGDLSWSEVTRTGRGRRGRGGAGLGQQQRLGQMPGALGLLAGGEGRQALQQQQQQRTRNQEQYPKVITRRAGFITSEHLCSESK